MWPITGESLLIVQFAIKQASPGHAYIFAPLESLAAFMAMGLKNRILTVGVDTALVDERAVLINGTYHYQLHASTRTLLNTLAYGLK